MRDSLRCLRDLQAVDSRILELTKAREAFPARVAQLNDELQARSEELRSVEEKVAETSRERRLKELALAAEQEKLQKWEKRLMESTNPREATALSREIDANRRLNQESQEEILLLMAEEEGLGAEMEAHSPGLGELQSKLEKEEKECKARSAELDLQLAQHDKERNSILKNLPDRIARIYNQIRNRRLGVAVAPARDGSCGACQMTLPPQHYNQIQKTISIETCPSCNRILYWEKGLDDDTVS